MARAKQASKGNRSGKATSVLGVAGMSLAASATGVSAGMPAVDLTPAQGGDLTQSLVLGDEEISDVTLATFHLFDQDAVKSLPQSNVQLTRCGGCRCGGGGCRGCRGCGGGCRGCRGCGGRGCGCGWGGCGGCGWGGCCLSWGGCYLC